MALYMHVSAYFPLFYFIAIQNVQLASVNDLIEEYCFLTFHYLHGYSEALAIFGALGNNMVWQTIMVQKIIIKT